MLEVNTFLDMQLRAVQHLFPCFYPNDEVIWWLEQLECFSDYLFTPPTFISSKFVNITNVLNFVLKIDGVHLIYIEFLHYTDVDFARVTSMRSSATFGVCWCVCVWLTNRSKYLFRNFFIWV